MGESSEVAACLGQLEKVLEYLAEPADAEAGAKVMAFLAAHGQAGKTERKVKVEGGGASRGGGSSEAPSAKRAKPLDG
ncbi:uncharacterized protein AMSG_04497 [Thecamonas trahens ATCC 50062]|uniref:Uncharacterized protein n=1 Tax=Thecamonas trahens ATCC 50062 TaxID=461836 RepID=A0A0L0D7A4_THETB|nr:hypothetical protein AMSG_04497 [Thecamonas trahens ATCC 50062]KNC48267.1 hypothetical protein AMSG_04497 [Thecamonas trahens ATCC 50062]|eukprot:XP_013758834.1 hypothetical protein AMSG_04497 [Thecamonas trahens ATCC 50062]